MRSRLSRVVLFAICLAVLVAATAFVVLVRRDYEASLAAARERAEAATRLLEEHAHGSFHAADNVLRQAAERVAAGGMEAFAADPQAPGFLHELAARLPEAGDLLVADGNGLVRLDASGTAAGLNVADREYFQAPRLDGARMFVGRQIRAALDPDNRVFVLSRAVLDGDGRFAGVVFTGIRREYFAKFYAVVQLGPRAALSITRDDGAIVMRYPLGDRDDQANAASGASFSQFRGQIAATFLSVSPVDKVERVLSFRRLDGLPLIVTAGMAVDDALAGFRERLRWSAGFGATALLLVAAATWLAMAGLRREAAMAAALATADERTELALRLTPVALFEHDRDLRYTWFRNSLLGHPVGEIVGRCHDDFFIGGDDAKRRVLDTGRAERQEVLLRRRDGDPVWMDQAIAPILARNGRVAGLRCAAIDVSDRKRVEATLQALRADAERAAEEKSRFLAAASHDLRQPFQAMRLFYEVLDPLLTSERQRAIGAKIEEAMRSGEALLSALLDISTLDAGIVRPKLDHFALDEVLAPIIAECEPQAAGVGLHYVPCSAMVESDRVLLGRLVRNLVLNALRYTESGKVLVGCRRAGRAVSVQVWDTGVGIPEDKLSAIFEDFYQIGNAERDRSRGLGLGLSVVRRTALLLGHSVAVRSRPGRGSGFQVAVPLAPQPAQPQPAPQPAVSPLSESRIMSRT